RGHRPSPPGPPDSRQHQPRDRREPGHGGVGGHSAPGHAAGEHRSIDASRSDVARLPKPGRLTVLSDMLKARVDRHKCIGAGNCITLAPTAFDWLAGDFGKADVVGPGTVEDELLR